MTTLSLDWSFRGGSGEFSIGAAATPQTIVWVRYDTGISGKVTAINRATKALMGTQATDLGPYNVVSYGGQVALLGQGAQSNSDWHVHWIDVAGFPSTRSDTMNVVVAGGGIIGGAMYPEPDAGMAVHVVASASSSGPHVSAITNEDGGVTRTTHPCANENWWDGATMDGTNRRYFIGNVFNGACDLGNGNPIVPMPTATRQWVVARYAGVKAPGNAYVQPLGAAFKATGPAALGVTSDSLWVAYYSTTSHLRVERLNPNNLSSMIVDEATGQSFVTNTTDLGLSVADIVPHPTRDRVYVMASLFDAKSTWRAETIPAFNRSTILIFTFEASTMKLLGVGMLPSTAIGKYGSQMALIDDHLVVTGQCTATPPDAGAEPLCSPTPTPVGQEQSFIFSTPAP